MPIDWGQYADAPDPTQPTAQVPAMDWNQFADTTPTPDPVQTPTSISSAPAQGAIDWGQFADSPSNGPSGPGGGMSGMQSPATPTITAGPVTQTGKNSFQLGLESAGQWVNDLPLVQEVKNSPWEETLGNLGVGAVEGLAQIGDVAQTLATPVEWMTNAIPRGIEGAYNLATQGKFETPFVDSLQPEHLNLGQQIRQTAEEIPGYNPATFKTGALLGQAMLPASTGIKTTSALGAAGLGAAENAIMGGVSNAGEQLSETGNIDPGQLALAMGISAPLGAGAGALGHGINSLFKPKPAPFVPHTTDAGLPAYQMTGGPSKETLEAMRAAPTPPPPVDAMGMGAARMPGEAPVQTPNVQTKPAPDMASLMGAPAAKMGQAQSAPIQAQQVQPRDLSEFGLTAAVSKNVQEPSMPPAMPTDEQAVFRHQRTAFGRNKADEGIDVSQFPPEVQKAVQSVAEAKAKLDYQNKAVEDYTKQVWDLADSKGLIHELSGALVGKNGAFISRKTESKLPVAMEADLQKLREKYAIGTTKATSKQHVSSLLGGRYGGGGNFDMKMPEFRLPDDVEKAMDNLVRLRRTALATEKEYKAVKEAAKPQFDAAQERLRQSNPQASFNAKTKVLGPLKQEIDANVSLDHNAMKLKLTQEGEAIYQKAKEEKYQQLAADRNYQPKTSFDLNIANVAKSKKAKKVLGLAAAALAMNQGQARAEDGSDGTDNGFDWSTAGRLALGAAALHYAAPKLARKILNPETTKLSLMFNDTVQRIEHLDQLMGTRTAGDIWQHLGAVHNASFGVKIDPEIRQQAMQALRDGDMPAFQGLNLNAEQERALLTYDKIRGNLGTMIRNHIADAEAHIEAMKKAGDKTQGAEIGLDALREMEKSLTGTRKSIVEKAYNAGLSKFMDYHFFYNPAFHLTNLSDQAVSVAPKIGPMNLYAANKAFVSNPRLQKLFDSSNLTGGFEAEKANAAAIGQQAKKPFALKDFKSDKINADRAALGAMFQYRQTHGIAGSDEEFAEKLLTNQLDPAVAVDAWAHTAETLSRTVGADPMRVNTDAMSAAIPALTVFIKQPARVTNLMTHYLANGDMKKMYLMLGGMALVAGDSAIPQDAKEIWKRVDPKACFMASSLLSKAEITQYATGKTLAPKAQWAILAPLMASSDPLRSASGSTLSAAFETMQKLSEGGDPGGKAYAAIGGFASLLSPRIKGIPAKQLINMVKTGQESMGEGKKITYYDKFGRYANSDEVSFNDLGISPVKNFADQFLPGEQVAVQNRKRAKEEESYRKKNFVNWMGDQSEGPVFNKESDGYANDPFNMLLRSITGTGK